MKKLISAALLLLFSSGLLFTNAQNKQAEQMARKIADRILSSTSYTFVNNKTGEKYETVKNLPLSYDIVAESKYNQWHYTNGVTNIAMLELAEKLGEKKYENFVLRNMNFVFNEGNLDYFRQLYDSAFNQSGWFAVRKVSWHMIFRGKRLDDNGPMGASLIEIQKKYPNEVF
jgi:hypothetical protein